MYRTLPVYKDLLTVQDVARRLAISVRTVWRWTAAGILPRPVHPRPGCTRWYTRDVERYLDQLGTARAGSDLPPREVATP